MGLLRESCGWRAGRWRAAGCHAPCDPGEPGRGPGWDAHAYTGRPLRISRAIRAGAWALVAAGVAAPVLRRRVKLPPAAVMVAAALAPPALAVAMAPSRRREVGDLRAEHVGVPGRLRAPARRLRASGQRVRIDYPIDVDRVLGLGVPPDGPPPARLSDPGAINRFERVLVFCHWIWFAVPHASVVYVLVRRPERFPSAAARMYAVFDLGAIFYWAIPDRAAVVRGPARPPSRTPGVPGCGG